MSSPVRPEPDNWLLEHMRAQLQPAQRQRGPQSPFAPADALAIRTAPRKATLADYGHAARQVAGGAVKGVVSLLDGADVAGMLGLLSTPAEEGSLRTVGRGEVRPSAAPPFSAAVARFAAAGNHMADVNGDLAAGGPPKTLSDSTFRGLGNVAGNLAAWEASSRAVPKLLASLRGAEEVAAPTASSKIVKHYGPTPFLTETAAHPLELPPAGLSHEEQMAWNRRAVNRRMGRPEGTGAPRGYANASGQEMFNNHLRRVGLLPVETPAPAGGLLDALPTMDESGRIGVFHGSPHKFPPEPEHPLGRFDISKIGTGEGAQAYGHGLYFAGDEGVAKFYRESLAPRPEVHSVTLDGKSVGTHNNFDYNPRGNSAEENIRSSLFEDLLLNESDLAQAHDAGTLQQHVLGRLDQRIADMRTEWPEGVPAAERLRARLAKPGAVKANITANPGALYRAEIDAEPEHFLDWDKPLSEQSAYVRERLAKIDSPLLRDMLRPEEAMGNRGEDVYKVLQMERANSPRNASAALREAGIPGNRYLNGASRGPHAASNPGHNYVVFSDQPIKITGREGHGALPTLGALGLLSGGALTVAAKKGLLDP